jgi:ubiquinone biosynthesis protein COQ4
LLQLFDANASLPTICFCIVIFFIITMLINLFLKNIDRLSNLLGASVPAFVNLDELRSLPPNTLGRAWADCLDRHGLLPLTTGPRRKQLHDGIHVLTGYGTDPLGELEVQAFLMGAKSNLIHIALSLGLLKLLRQQIQRPLSSPQVRHRLWNAYQRGRCSCLDVDTWMPESMWHVPLAQVQARFQIAK